MPFAREGQGAVAAVGECMVELSPAGGGLHRLGFGGDTLNTAVVLARLGVPVRYVTALGDDPYSERMVEAWAGEGIDVSVVARLPGRMPGLYAIELDGRGERRFHYWRGEAAARDLVTAVDLAAVLSGADLAYVSGITLSVVRPADREAFLAALATARGEGTRIAFDTNFRARAWPDLAEARALFARAMAGADLVLTGMEDLAGLALATDVSGAEAALAAVPAETVLRVAPDACRLRDGPAGPFADVALVPVSPVVDTTGAGDAFNAGYLAARLAGREPAAAVGIAHAVASVQVMHRGAIVPRGAADWAALLGAAPRARGKGGRDDDGSGP